LRSSKILIPFFMHFFINIDFHGNFLTVYYEKEVSQR